MSILRKTASSNGTAAKAADTAKQTFSEVTQIISAKASDMKDFIVDMANDEKKRKEVLNSPYVSKAMSAAAIVASRKNRALRLVHRTYQKLQGKSTTSEIWSNITESTKLMARMVRSYVTGNYRHVPWPVIVKATGAMIYLVWIIDLIPDFIPIAGFMDDAVVLLWVFSLISEELERFKIWETRQD